jgi:hypothetical protein
LRASTLGCLQQQNYIVSTTLVEFQKTGLLYYSYQLDSNLGYTISEKDTGRKGAKDHLVIIGPVRRSENDVSNPPGLGFDA